MPGPVRDPQLISAIHVLDAERADVGGDDDVLGVPQGVVLGEGFGVSDIEGGASESLVVERGDQRGLVDDGAARDIDDERAFGALLARRGRGRVRRRRREQRELLLPEQVPRRRRQRQRDQQRVQPRRQERVQRRLRSPAVPRLRNRPVWVPRPRNPVPPVLA